MKSILFSALLTFVVLSNKLYAQSTLCFTSASDNIIRTSSGARSLTVNDFNGDGIPDVVVTNLSSNVVSVLIGQGDRSFRSPEIVAQISQPLLVVSEDFNNDGKVDIAVSAVEGPLTILAGDGTGKFDVTETYDDFQGATILKSADFNGDNKKDIVGYLPGTSTIAVKLGDGAGKLLETTSIQQSNGIKNIVAADFTGDAVADIAFIHLDDVVIAQSDAAGVFTKHEIIQTLDFDLINADFNNDGKEDLYLLKGKLLLGNGTMAFPNQVDVKTIWNQGQVSVGQLNDDSYIDIVVVNPQGIVTIYYSANGASFDEAVSYNAGSNPSEVVAKDMDDDGRVDLVVADFDSNGGVLILYNDINDFSGAESYAAAANDFGLMTADVNNDGRLDIISASYNNQVSALVQDEDGTFNIITSDVSISGGERVAGDFNGDNNTDIIATDFNTGNIDVFYGNGNGSFTDGPVYEYNSTTMSAADFDNDGKLDLVVNLQSTNFVKVMMPDGGGGFTDVNYSAGILGITRVRTGDFNNDGKIDIVCVAEGFSAITVLFGHGDGTFAAPTNFAIGTTLNANSVSYFADLNNDGKTDLVFAGKILINTGSEFALVSTIDPGTPISTIAHGFFDNDNFIDIAVGGPNLNNVLIYRGNGNGTFSAPMSFATGVANILLAADVNEDGATDIIASGAMLNILRNNTARIGVSGTVIGCNSSISLTGTASGFNYQWSTPAGSAFGQTIAATIRGTYTLTISNASEQCRTMADVYVDGKPAPAATSIINTTCVDGTGSIIVENQDNDDRYSFDNGDTFQDENFKSGLQPGDYKIVIRSADGCDSEAVTVTVDPQPAPPTEPVVSASDPSCSSHTGSITITVQKECDTYSFDNGISFQGANVKTGLMPGEYKVLIRRSIGCFSDVVETTINHGPEIPSKPVINPISGVGGTITLQSTEAAGYEWSKNFVPIPDATSQTYQVGESGIYTVVVLSVDGCRSEASESYSAIISGDIDDDITGFYPNPADSYLYMKTSGKRSESVIYTSSGKQIAITPSQTAEELVYDVRSFSPGVYVLKVTIEGYTRTIRWVKR